VHEQIADRIRRSGALAHADVTILHHGYRPGVIRNRRKTERNLRLIRQALSEDDTPLLRFSLGVEYMRLEDFAAARRELLGVWGETRRDEYFAPWAVRDLVACDLMLGEHEEAIRHASEGLDRFPGYPDLLYLKGEALASLGRCGEAIRALEECLRTKPASPSYSTLEGLDGYVTLTRLGDLYRSLGDSLGDPDRARDHYRRAARDPRALGAVRALTALGEGPIDPPEDEATLLAVVDGLMDRGELEQAERLLEDRRSAAALYRKGLLALQRGDRRRAHSLWLELRGADLEEEVGLALVLLSAVMGFRDQARAGAEEMARRGSAARARAALLCAGLDPGETTDGGGDLGRHLWEVVDTALELGFVELVPGAVREISARSEDHEGVILRLAKLLYAHGYTEEAAAQLELIPERCWADAEAARIMADLWRGRGELELAASYYEDVLRLVPEHVASRISLASLLLQLGRPSRALEVLSEAPMASPVLEGLAGLIRARMRLAKEGGG